MNNELIFKLNKIYIFYLLHDNLVGLDNFYIIEKIIEKNIYYILIYCILILYIWCQWILTLLYYCLFIYLFIFLTGLFIHLFFIIITNLLFSKYYYNIILNMYEYKIKNVNMHFLYNSCKL